MWRFLALPLLLCCNCMLQAQETVVLLHGLARSSASMESLASTLESEDYRVLNLDYDSRKMPIQDLAKSIRKRVVEQSEDARTVHFVTHSMGGIILRQIQRSAPIPKLGRVVMLSPPNHGSEVVDKIKGTWYFKSLNGPAGQQLGTAASDFVQQLGPVDFELGVLTGDRSMNWINSLMIPGKDDGKVSVESAKVEGMRAFKVVHATHPMIMKNKAVIQEVIHFLQTGHFK